MSKWIKKEDRLGHIGGKVCIFGATGTGKSQGAGTFPRINLVDAEDGQTFYLADNKNILNVLPTASASEVQEAMDELMSEDALKNFDTLLVDSGTKINDNMQASAYEIAEARARKNNMSSQKKVDMNDLNLTMRDWGHIKRWNQELQTQYIRFSNAGKWAVVTAHEQDITKEVGSGENARRIVVGVRPQLAKKAEHDFDIIIRTHTKEDPQTKEIKFLAEIQKDRTKVTKVGDVIDITNKELFEIWREKWESTRKLGVKNVDMTQDVKKSTTKMEFDSEVIDRLVERFKARMEELKGNEKGMTKVQAKLKELKITNPLNPKSKEEMEELLEFMATIK